MVRAIHDTTSTCETCRFWTRHEDDYGMCGYSTLPAWARQLFIPSPTDQFMYADAGRDCWLHDKRHTLECATESNERAGCTCDGMPALMVGPPSTTRASHCDIPGCWCHNERPEEAR